MILSGLFLTAVIAVSIIPTLTSDDQRISAALRESECPEVEREYLDKTSYTGPLIDTHIHIPAIPDSPYEKFDENDEQEHPIMGVNATISDYICMMDSEETTKVFAFFPVWDPITQESLDLVKRTMKKYPDRFVPFIMPPDHDDRTDGFPTVNATELAEMLNVYPGLFKGYGEIGLYERGDHGGPKGAPALPPDSERLLEIYPVVKKHNLLVYVHLGEGQKENFENALELFPA
ncbi:hypothetical protein HY605_00810, partial [Candidatus Peregrinibacteria bacterium]|nr:hypothetical protein [Candidatus Peregrinibacteria bacterium]